VIEQSIDARGVVTLTLNRPDAFNALSEAMLHALYVAIEEAGGREATRIIIIAARGRAFCAGHDLKEMRAKRFAVSGVRLGLFCSTPSVALSRNIPRKQAFEMLVTGDFIDAAQAQTLGLINRVADDTNVADEVESLAASIVAKPAVAIRTGKSMFYAQLEKPLEEAYEYAAHMMACNMMSDDALEGVQAFIDRVHRP